MEINVQELKTLRDKRAMIFLIDVRTPQEWKICRLTGATLIPMHELMQQIPHIQEVLGDRKVIVYCHHGNRSLIAAHMLQEAGIPAQSLRGGIDHWSVEIDPAVPRY
jgi:sulfur-carrier protein adenylyltransferase/sulfurtransferase